MKGRYYFFDCMNADVCGAYKVNEFESEAEAIAMASNYEASLYLYEYDENGNRVSRQTIWEPAF